MTDPTNIVLWKVVTILREPPPLSRQNLLFHVSENPGLYRQFGIASQHRYLPYLLTPTITYHQTIRNLLTKKLQIHTKEPRQPLKLYIPSIAVEGIFQIAQIRLFQPNILSLTARLSGLPLYLAPDALIQIQRLNEIKPISEIMRWTIGMAQTLDHRKMEVPSSFRPKPAISLQVQCDSTTLVNHINENLKQYIGVLIRNPDYNLMDPKLATSILDDNKEHNVKSSAEMLLLNRQGILLISPTTTATKRSSYSRLSRAHDLFELVLVFDLFLKEYLSISKHDDRFSDAMLEKIRVWIEKASLVFSESTSTNLEWNLLCNSLHLSDRLPELHAFLRDGKILRGKHKSDTGISSDSDCFFESIRKAIDSGRIDQQLKEIAITDLEQAQIAYKCAAYKSCVVMLGAVLEGLMLATILRDDMLQKLKKDRNCPKTITKLGILDPELKKLIAEKLSFEDLKNIIHYLFPQVEKLKIEAIQSFRNAIHPSKAANLSGIFGEFSSARAMHHITSLEILVKHIL